jgi:hypothetical protein
MAIVFNDNITINAGKPIDSKFGPYLSIADANQSIPLARRYNGLIFGVYTNPNDIPNSDIIFYYYYGEFTDIEISVLIAGDDKNFVFIQLTPASVWNIVHSLNKFPAITVLDNSNNEVFCDITHIDVNQVQLNFSINFSGKAIFN